MSVAFLLHHEYVMSSTLLARVLASDFRVLKLLCVSHPCTLVKGLLWTFSYTVVLACLAVEGMVGFLLFLLELVGNFLVLQITAYQC